MNTHEKEVYGNSVSYVRVRSRHWIYWLWKYSDYVVPNNDTTGGGTFFVYSKGDEELRDAIDEAIVALREDGTLKEISESVLGADYTEPETESSES